MKPDLMQLQRFELKFRASDTVAQAVRANVTDATTGQLLRIAPADA